MVEFKWIYIFLFLMPVLQFQAITGQDTYVTVRDGDGFVTLPCGNVRKNQDQCNGTDWLFSNSERSPVIELVKLGQIGENVKSDRLSVTPDCSLVIKNITPTDFGRYTCRQYNEHGLSDASVFLSVINMYEDKENYTRKLICSVLTYEYCGYTVELLDEGNRHNFTNQKSSCSASVTFKTPPLLRGYACKVREINNSNILLCSFTPQSSCKKIDPDESHRTMDSPANQENGREVSSSLFSDLPHWWMYVVVASGFAALLIIVGVVIRLRRTKGNRTPAEDGTGQRLNPPETQAGPDNFQETVEFEVPYATISFKKRSNGHTQACGENDDDEEDEVDKVDEEKEEDLNNVHEDCAVTSSSEAASPNDSTDLSSLYATVKKKKKADVEEES